MISKTIYDIISMIDGSLYLNNFTGFETVTGVSIDSRKINEDNIYFALSGVNSDGHDFIIDAINKGAKLIILSNPDKAPVDVPFIIVEDVVAALQSLAIEYRKELEGKVISVTGSNGKTSTKDILYSVLKVKFKVEKTQGNFNNELGVPLTILSFDVDSDFYIVEVGMEKCGDILFLKDMINPNIGIVTNVGLAHLTTFGSIENIGIGKLEMFDIIGQEGLFLYNIDDKILSKLFVEKENKNNIIVETFGTSSSATWRLSSCFQNATKLNFKVNNEDYSANIVGKYQSMNILPVIAIAKRYEMSSSDINKGLENIEFSSLRNDIFELDGTIILNDTYKSNPQSAIAALDTFESIKRKNKYVVFADMLDLGENSDKIHFDLGIDSLNYTYDEILLYGDLSINIANAVKNNSDRIAIHFDSHEDLADYLKDKLGKDSAILLKGSRGMRMEKVIELLKK